MINSDGTCDYVVNVDSSMNMCTAVTYFNEYGTSYKDYIEGYVYAGFHSIDSYVQDELGKYPSYFDEIG